MFSSFQHAIKLYYIILHIFVYIGLFYTFS
jgi:hypothetical protein